MPARKTVEPLRVRLRDALVQLALSRRQFYRLHARGLFTVIAPTGERRRGCAVYLHPDEVRAYAERGEDALREVMARRAARRK